jgi:hypothetical protein
MKICLNCDNNFEGEFCNLCGQKSATHRFTMHEWLHEIPHSLFHIDSGFFATLKILLVRPGDSIREYLQGKRKLLFSPFLYVLILCGFFVVNSHFFESPNEAAKQIDFANLKETTAYIEEHYYKIIVVAMILPMTLGSFFAYYKSGYNFAENLVLNAYLIGQLVIADIILILISATSFDENYSPALKFIEFILKYPYWFWMYWQFFKPKKWYWGILQFILAQIIAGLALYLLMNGAALVLLKFKGAH